jgi:hypothetical protein
MVIPLAMDSVSPSMVSRPLEKVKFETDCPFTVTEETEEALMPTTSIVSRVWEEKPPNVFWVLVDREPEEVV